MDPLIGREIEGYRIESELGRGGQAVVYRATQLSLQRTVALKVVSPELSSDANYRERFTREGIAAANLEHPHVIPVYEAGDAEGVLYLAMKFVDGPSLDGLMRAPGGIEARRALEILRQVADALDYMAAQSMVHRDVKPANILMGPADHAYLSDFGLIKAISATRLTSPGVWMGTLEYVSPEQIRGAEVTPAADRYALACLAFEALTGRVPFPHEDRTAALFAHVNDEPPRASEVNPRLDAGVDAVLMRGMAKTPADRPPTARALIDELAAAVAAAGASDSHPPAPAA
ncbi:MAG TPA: serine/threonine-protein kinase, partial [Miltoncostaeaceae bacterium]|nr:serine/threonine-protein kinase [Miltoncostaeaceae bacterium]